jgi:hypothetical protein
MIILAKKLLQQETDADKKEFVKGMIGLTPEQGRKKALVGVVAGYLLASRLSKK